MHFTTSIDTSGMFHISQECRRQIDTPSHPLCFDCLTHDSTDKPPQTSSSKDFQLFNGNSSHLGSYHHHHRHACTCSGAFLANTLVNATKAKIRRTTFYFWCAATCREARPKIDPAGFRHRLRLDGAQMLEFELATTSDRSPSIIPSSRHWH